MSVCLRNEIRWNYKRVIENINSKTFFPNGIQWNGIKKKSETDMKLKIIIYDWIYIK